MNHSKTLLALVIAGALSIAASPFASAQVVIAGPLVPIPSYPAPIVLPSPSPVVSAYRVPSVAPRVAGYGVYQPVVAPPVYVAPAPVQLASPVTVAAPNVLYRPAVVGSSVSGLPTVYIPGQPVRNALRYVVP